MNEKAMWIRNLPLFGVLGLAFLAGCGGGTAPSIKPTPSTPTPSGLSKATPVILTIRDTPPQGIAVLSFGVTVTGAALQPGDVSLLANPIQVEIRRLEVESALLGFASVPGNYASLTLTFSNPELTILNNTGTTIDTCATGTICEFKPALAFASVTFSGPPFPLTASANLPVSLMLDFDLTNSIANNLATINPIVTVTGRQLTGEQGPALESIKDVFGRVSGVSFGGPIGPVLPSEVLFVTLETDRGPVTFYAGGAQSDSVDIGCVDFNEACLLGQFWQAEIALRPDGLSATRVRLKPVEEETLEGVIVDINPATAQFDVVTLHKVPDVPQVNVGNRVRVNLLPGTAFGRVGATTTGLNFSGASDLLMGQVVEVRLRSTPSGASPGIDTDRVLLSEGSFTAKVKAKLDAESFTVESLPGIFTSAQIRADTFTGSVFENVSSVAALNVGDTVSLGGLLFKTAGDPVLVTEKVRKR